MTRSANRRTREAALADELTGLTNRRGFDLALSARLATDERGADGTCLLLAEKLRATIERSRIRRSDNQQEIAQITVSFGIARYCAGESANDFVSRVDNALYLSKRLGRNRVTLASERQMRFS